MCYAILAACSVAGRVRNEALKSSIDDLIRQESARLKVQAHAADKLQRVSAQHVGKSWRIKCRRIETVFLIGRCGAARRLNVLADEFGSARDPATHRKRQSS